MPTATSCTFGSTSNVIHSRSAVKLNDVELITGTFNETTQIPVTLELDNTLEVALAGDTGDYVTISGLAAYGARVTVYGPTQFTRAPGPLVTIAERFGLPWAVNAPDSLVLVNGNPDSTARVPYGWVWPNGTWSHVLGRGVLRVVSRSGGPV